MNEPMDGWDFEDLTANVLAQAVKDAWDGDLFTSLDVCLWLAIEYPVWQEALGWPVENGLDLVTSKTRRRIVLHERVRVSGRLELQTA